MRLKSPIKFQIVRLREANKAFRGLVNKFIFRRPFHSPISDDKRVETAAYSEVEAQSKNALCLPRDAFCVGAENAMQCGGYLRCLFGVASIISFGPIVSALTIILPLPPPDASLHLCSRACLCPSVDHP